MLQKSVVTEHGDTVSEGIVFLYVRNYFLRTDIIVLNCFAGKAVCFCFVESFAHFGVLIVRLKIFFAAAVIAGGTAAFYELGANLEQGIVGFCIANSGSGFKTAQKRACDICIYR